MPQRLTAPTSPFSIETPTPEQQAANRKKNLDAMEAKFSQDAPDPVRGARIEHALGQAVSGDTMTSTGIAPDDVAIQCKRHSCRIVAKFKKAGDAEDWAIFYLTAAGQNLARSRIAQSRQSDGMTEVRIYAERIRG